MVVLGFPVVFLWGWCMSRVGVGATKGPLRGSCLAVM
ncbi:hypothetical protein Pyrfu_0466 [Pyrolobus fumarii 1A]|uniref:Uncharacterized protein n=1 Tax=Pyrolobus fumarii (strain DSM 11204 / 1A) TaxID=694429 RepID=G0EG89_PYRF1|nr:hypothetical protein Pyrfu_0466 [Pyrolobus fumarii 1A]